MKILTPGGWKPLNEETLDEVTDKGRLKRQAKNLFRDAIADAGYRGQAARKGQKNPYPKGTRHDNYERQKKWMDDEDAAAGKLDEELTVEDFAELMDVDYDDLMELSEEAYDELTDEFLEYLDEDRSRNLASVVVGKSRNARTLRSGAKLAEILAKSPPLADKLEHQMRKRRKAWKKDTIPRIYGQRPN